MDIRRVLLIKDVVYAEGGLPSMAPVTRAAACAVIANPLAGRALDDLDELVPMGTELGELLVKDALKALAHPAISYGKAAIVGVSGDIEPMARPALSILRAREQTLDEPLIGVG